jgi:hypothetical protein
MSEVIGAGSWVLDLLREGLSFDWRMNPPSHYREKNNKSGLDNLASLRETVATWEKGGYVRRLNSPATCCNPMTVAVQYNSVLDTTKYRPCIDLSRHVNLHIAKSSVRLDHLDITQELIAPGDFMTALDLENQFFQIRLSPEMCQYLGFAVPDEDGKDIFYEFTVMAYGCTPAVMVVTRLLRPIKAYAHRLGIKFSIYIDDGRTSAASSALCDQHTQFVLLLLQLAGWRIQWKKTCLVPTTKLLHLGFFTNSTTMTYSITPEKWSSIRLALQSLLASAAQSRLVSPKDAASVLGRLNSLHRSHGSVVRVLSRSLQHQLGLHVDQHGWKGLFSLSPASTAELAFLLGQLPSFHGRAIPTQQALSHVPSLWQAAAARAAVASSLVPTSSDKDCSRSYVYLADGTFSHSVDLIGEASEATSCLKELLSLSHLLQAESATLRSLRARTVYWSTDSEACSRFVVSGSRNTAIQRVVYTLKCQERDLGITVVPVWSPRSGLRLCSAGATAPFSRSTDEWSVDRQDLAAVFHALGVFPDTDCFATALNAVCPIFFSRSPHPLSAGVDFFAKPPQPRASLFLCPPVTMVARAFGKVLTYPNSSAVLLAPRWRAAAFWPILHPGGTLHPSIRREHHFSPRFFTSAPVSSLFTSGAPIQMVAFHILT